MTMSLMFVLLAAITAMQPNKQRFLIALVFTSEIIIHDIFFGSLNGELYFFIASLGNMIAMVILHSLSTIYKLAERLSMVCLIAIPANFMGYILWYNRFPTWIYETLFILIYSYAVIVMFNGSIHARSNKSNGYSARVHDHFHHSSKLSSKNL